MTVLHEGDFVRLRQLRARHPDAIAQVFATRKRRDLFGADGRLLILAADHAARGALAVGDNPNAMGNRCDLLERLAVALTRPGVDGVLGTPDIIEDLALLGLLDDKIVVGSVNRGGLRGASFEMDDRCTGYSVEAILANSIDFAKALLRINLADPATAPTLEAISRAVTEAARARLPIMLEPFMSRWSDGHIVNDLSPDAVIRSVAIASGLGSSSAYTWMKLPVVPDMERVMSATTLPTLLLGGDSGTDLNALFASWAHALSLPGVCGMTAGRNLLYPANEDVAGVVDVVARLVHPHM